MDQQQYSDDFKAVDCSEVVAALQASINAVAAIVTLIIWIPAIGVAVYTICTRSKHRPAEFGVFALFRVGVLALFTGIVGLLASSSWLASILTLSAGSVAVATLRDPAAVADIVAKRRSACSRPVHAFNLAISAIVFACLGFVANALTAITTSTDLQYVLATAPSSRSCSHPPTSTAWYLSICTAGVPLDAGIIAVCAAFIGLYNTYMPLLVVPALTDVTVVRVATAAEADELRFAAKPPSVQATTAGFDLVALPQGGIVALPQAARGAGGTLSLNAPPSGVYSSDGSSYAAPQSLLPVGRALGGAGVDEPGLPSVSTERDDGEPVFVGDRVPLMSRSVTSAGAK